MILENQNFSYLYTVNKTKLFFKLMIVLIISMIVFPVYSQTGEPSQSFKLDLPTIAAILAGFYEVLSRIIPTSKNWTIIGKVLEFLLWLSNLLNRKQDEKEKKH